MCVCVVCIVSIVYIDTIPVIPTSMVHPGEMLRALTAEQLMATASGEDLAKARRRLRAMQRNRGRGSDGCGNATYIIYRYK